MNIDGSKVLAIEITLALMAVPFLVWLALYAAARWWSVGLRPVLPWMRPLRWIIWISGMALGFIHLARDRFPVGYGIVMIGLSVGLSLPESWVKRRFAPDLGDSNSPDGWWPS